MPESTQPGPEMGLHALITAYCAQGHVIGQWIDETGPKYRVECESCPGIYPGGYAPEFIKTEVVRGFFTPGGAFVVAPTVQAIPTDGQLGG